MESEKEILQWEEILNGFPYSVYIGDLDSAQVVVFPQHFSASVENENIQSTTHRTTFDHWCLSFSEEERCQLRDDIENVAQRKELPAIAALRRAAAN